MENILSNYSVSISELKKSPSAILAEAGDEAVAVLNHNVPSAYLVPSKTYEKLLEIAEAYEFEKLVKKKLEEDEVPIEVSLDASNSEFIITENIKDLNSNELYFNFKVLNAKEFLKRKKL